jgi:hypothetical protein
METDKFVVKIRLANGIWKCDCTPVTVKNKLHFKLDITPPKDYKPEKLFESIDFNFNPASMDFSFDRWQFDDDEYNEVLEEELSTKIVQRLVL